MAKTKKHAQSVKIIAWSLFFGAVIVEIVNIWLAFHLGALQANKCPKDTVPGFFVLIFSCLSIGLTFIATGLTPKRYRGLTLMLAAFWAVLIIVEGYFLSFVANGGINFCGLHW